MRSSSRFVGLVALTALVGWLAQTLTGCGAGAQFRSVVAPDFKGPLTKLYVLANVGAGTRRLERADDLSVLEFAAGIDALGKQCGVTSVVEEYRQDLVLTPGAENAPIDRLIGAGADRVLTVRLQSGQLDQGGGVAHSDYEMRLLDLNSERTLWSAVARIGSGGNRSEVLAKCLVLQLSLDGVLPASCAKPLEETAPREHTDYRRNATKPSKWDPACGIGN